LSNFFLHQRKDFVLHQICHQFNKLSIHAMPPSSAQS
jgi:hypothetical protein